MCARPCELWARIEGKRRRMRVLLCALWREPGLWECEGFVSMEIEFRNEVSRVVYKCECINLAMYIQGKKEDFAGSRFKLILFATRRSFLFPTIR